MNNATVVTAQDVAEYFLIKASSEEDSLSNLKLQKLLYYAQGFHLAIYDTPLFADTIEHWMHGPVVPTVYDRYKNCGSGPIAVPTELNERLSNDKKEFLDQIHEVYGQYSAWRLRNMTHDEAPWKNTHSRQIISHEVLKDFFQTRIN